MKPATKKPELSLVVQYGCADTRLPLRAQIRRWVAATQEKALQVTVRFVAAREGRLLNRDFRGKDYATNVLTFVYESGENGIAGDIVVCLPVVLREARQQKKLDKSHMAHLIVHGVLHLQGYDHETGAGDARRMEDRERQILARFGIADPYRHEQA